MTPDPLDDMDSISDFVDPETTTTMLKDTFRTHGYHTDHLDIYWRELTPDPGSQTVVKGGASCTLYGGQDKHEQYVDFRYEVVVGNAPDKDTCFDPLEVIIHLDEPSERSDN